MKQFLPLLLLLSAGLCEIGEAVATPATAESRKSDIVIPTSFGQNIKVSFNDNVRGLTVDGHKIVPARINQDEDPQDVGTQTLAEEHSQERVYDPQGVHDFFAFVKEANESTDDMEYMQHNQVALDNLLLGFEEAQQMFGSGTWAIPREAYALMLFEMGLMKAFYIKWGLLQEDGSGRRLKQNLSVKAVGQVVGNKVKAMLRAMAAKAKFAKARKQAKVQPPHGKFDLLRGIRKLKTHP